ncbi:hypothetical protein J7E29_04195 [Streptomyces sp. ISL-90]|nr:hypothetical protein [Streptomyces sp. ISL-90]
MADSVGTLASIDADELTRRVLRVPGVLDVYRPVTRLTSAPATLAGRIKSTPAKPSSAVELNTKDGHVSIETSIATDRDARSVIVAREVADVLRGAAEEAGHTDATVRVQISRIA